MTIKVTRVNDPPVVDLNGSDEPGIDFATIFAGNLTAISDRDAILADVDAGLIDTATAGNGNIFVVNSRPARVTKIDPITRAQTQISSGGLVKHWRNLAIDDATGDFYVAGGRSSPLVKVNRDTGAETIVASGFVDLWGIAFEADGNLLVADRNRGNGILFRVVPATGATTTVATGLNDPFGIAVESNGDILVAEHGQIRRIDPANGAKTTVSSGFDWVGDWCQNNLCPLGRQAFSLHSHV